MITTQLQDEINQKKNDWDYVNKINDGVCSKENMMRMMTKMLMIERW